MCPRAEQDLVGSEGPCRGPLGVWVDTNDSTSSHQHLLDRTSLSEN